MTRPPSCTLPAASLPARTAEFTALFAQADIQRPAPDRLTLTLPPPLAVRAAELAAGEAECCSFFTFHLLIGAGTLRLDITVPAERTDVLDALAGLAP
jgi:hypothetical protein